MSKRLFDIVVSLVGVVLALPVMAVIAVLVRLDSRGPVLFRQERIGKDGRPFHILKFRSMVDRAYTLGPRLTQKRDPRVTRVGNVLRWLKLDELPQLFNVLRGDMSIVGPRPEDPHFVALYSPAQRAVLSVRPGIVGPSQILGRDELERYPEGADTERYYIDHILPDKLQTDLEYVRSAGLRTDLGMIGGAMAVTVFGALKKRFLRDHRARVALLAADTLLAVATYYMAFTIKFEGRVTPELLRPVLTIMAMIVVVRAPLFVYFGLYQQSLRYIGTAELLAIGKAVTLGTVVVTAATLLVGFRSHSRVIFVIDWALLVIVMSGLRMALKRRLTSGTAATQGVEKKNVILVGASDAAGHVAAALANDPDLPYRAVGFLDDDVEKHGVTIHGIRVLGCLRDLAVVAAIEDIHLVVVMVGAAAGPALRELLDYCRSHGLAYRLVPSLDRLLDGAVSMHGLDGEPDTEIPTPVAETSAAATRNGTNGANGNGVPETRDAAVDATEPRDEPTLVVGERPDPIMLVTGGAGFVGSHLVRKLLARGYRVRVVDSFLYGRHGLEEIADHPRLEIIEGDIRHLHTMALATKDVWRVIALAALVGDPACALNPDETMSTNFESTRLLAQVCRRSGVDRVVFASSCSVYGANNELTLNEGSWLNPVSLYARTRIQSEEELLRHADDLPVTILRLSTVFGLSPRIRLDLVVNTFAAHAYFNKLIRVFGGRQWRPNLHVQDAAEAFIAAAEAPEDRVAGEIFNVGDNALNHTVLDIARVVAAQSPNAALEFAEGLTDERDYRVSFDKIRHVMGFRTRFTVEDGVRELLDAFRRMPIDPNDARYSNIRFLKTHGFSPTFRRSSLEEVTS